MNPLALLFLWLLPVTVAAIALACCRRHVFSLMGISFGLVVGPASIATYSLIYGGIWLFPLGILGGFLSGIHGPPGFYLGMVVRLVDPTMVGDLGPDFLIMQSMNAAIWGTVYGFVGWFGDRRRQYLCERIQSVLHNRLAGD